jgi:uncharacterized protein YaaN involved in tellurite resistance
MRYENHKPQGLKMAYITQLKHLIQNELIPDVEEHIDDIFESIASQKDATVEERAQLEDMQALRDEYKELLGEISSGQIDEEEAEQLYTELTSMREGEGDEEDEFYEDDEDEDEDDYDEFDLEDEDNQY